MTVFLLSNINQVFNIVYFLKCKTCFHFDDEFPLWISLQKRVSTKKLRHANAATPVSDAPLVYYIRNPTSQHVLNDAQL